MGDLSKHFDRHEFACSCGCGFDTVDVATLSVAEKVRSHFDRPAIVHSGCRCASYNRSIGGAADSQHTYGRAVDLSVSGVSAHRVAKFVKEVLGNTGGLGLYNTFTHIDTRTNGPARWDNRL